MNRGCRSRASLRRKQNGGSELGAIFAEVAVGAPVLLLTIFGAIDASVLAFRATSLQYAVDRVGRWATLGEVENDPESPGDTLSREDSIVYRIQREASKLGIDSSRLTIEICPIDVVCAPGTVNAGGPGSTIGIEVTNPESLLFAEVTLRASTLVRNEPYG